jgi:hypothetical protein
MDRNVARKKSSLGFAKENAKIYRKSGLKHFRTAVNRAERHEAKRAIEYALMTGEVFDA